MSSFQYHPDILAKYPNLAGGVVVGRGLRNGATPEPLSSLYLAEQQAVIARIGDKPLSELEPLAAWRSVFRSFGVEPTQYRSAAEALLRRMTKKGDIPSINTLVDIGNLVSIRYALPIAVVDVRALRLPITVRFADGTEAFRNLGQDEVDHPDPGEVVFTDMNGTVVARRWCWRQSDESGARDGTTDVVITAEAHHSGGRADAQSAVDDLLRLLRDYAGGDYDSAVLGQAQPGI